MFDFMFLWQRGFANKKRAFSNLSEDIKKKFIKCEDEKIRKNKEKESG